MDGICWCHNLQLWHVLFRELRSRHVLEVVEGHLQRAVPHGKGQLFDVTCGFKKVQRSCVAEAVEGLLLGDMFRVRLELGPEPLKVTSAIWLYSSREDVLFGW